MRKLIAFEQVSLDGYFTDANGDMSWAHQSHDDEEWNAYVEGNASGGGVLVFGRVTYQMMAGFWPTPTAKQTMPVVAKRMNDGQKIVFSRTLESADWNITTLLKGDLVEEIRRLKSEEGEGLVILGSGSIVAQLAEQGLIDEFQLIVNPLALAGGRTIFDNVTKPLALRRLESRTFENGNVLLRYQPA